MIASAGPDHYRQTIATLLATDEIDALVVIYIPVDVSQKPMILDGNRRRNCGRTAGWRGRQTGAGLRDGRGGRPCAAAGRS